MIFLILALCATSFCRIQSAENQQNIPISIHIQKSTEQKNKVLEINISPTTTGSEAVCMIRDILKNSYNIRAAAIRLHLKVNGAKEIRLDNMKFPMIDIYNSYPAENNPTFRATLIGCW